MADADTASAPQADAPESEAPRRSRTRNGGGEPRRGRDPAVNGRGERTGRLNGNGADAGDEPVGIDAAVLPPAFNPVEQMEGEPVAPVAPRRRRTKPVVQEGDAPIIVNG